MLVFYINLSCAAAGVSPSKDEVDIVLLSGTIMRKAQQSMIVNQKYLNDYWYCETIETNRLISGSSYICAVCATGTLNTGEKNLNACYEVDILYIFKSNMRQKSEPK